MQYSRANKRFYIFKQSSKYYLS